MHDKAVLDPEGERASKLALPERNDQSLMVRFEELKHGRRRKQACGLQASTDFGARRVSRALACIARPRGENRVGDPSWTVKVRLHRFVESGARHVQARSMDARPNL